MTQLIHVPIKTNDKVMTGENKLTTNPIENVTTNARTRIAR
jgi:hypothetical protein